MESSIILYIPTVDRKISIHSSYLDQHTIFVLISSKNHLGDSQEQRNRQKFQELPEVTTIQSETCTQTPFLLFEILCIQQLGCQISRIFVHILGRTHCACCWRASHTQTNCIIAIDALTTAKSTIIIDSIIVLCLNALLSSLRYLLSLLLLSLLFVLFLLLFSQFWKFTKRLSVVCHIPFTHSPSHPNPFSTHTTINEALRKHCQIHLYFS